MYADMVLDLSESKVLYQLVVTQNATRHIKQIDCIGSHL